MATSNLGGTNDKTRTSASGSRRLRFAVLGIVLLLPGAVVLGLYALGWAPLVSLFANPLWGSIIAVVCSIVAFVGVMILVLVVVGRIQQPPPAAAHDLQEP